MNNFLIYLLTYFYTSRLGDKVGYQGPIPILIGLGLVLTLGAYVICVMAGYSGVSYWYRLPDGQHALIYCVS
jgi:hypothetical protein